MDLEYYDNKLKEMPMYIVAKAVNYLKEIFNKDKDFKKKQ